MRFDLSDDERALLEPLMPRSSKEDWRRIATRYDQLARKLLAATNLVGSLYWIKL